MSISSATDSPGATHHNVVVVGMPRSGTSLVAGIFARRGYFVAEHPGRELRGGDHNNPGGYWEAGSLISANAELFASAGYPEDNSWLGAAAPEDLASRIGGLEPVEEHRRLVAQYQDHAPWMWKDPRLCYTLPYWWKLLPHDSTRVLLTKRDPDAIWQSFVRLHWRESTPEANEDVLARIDHHLSSAREALDGLGIPHLEVQYEHFSEDPTQMAATLSAFLDMSLTEEDLGFSKELDRSSWRGRMATLVDHSYERLPTPLRRLAKGLAPRSLVRLLFPERSMDR